MVELYVMDMANVVVFYLVIIPEGTNEFLPGHNNLKKKNETSSRKNNEC